MKILVLGGTRFFGIPMVQSLLEHQHEITLATRGRTPDPFGDKVSRLQLNRQDEKSIETALAGKAYDVVIDKTSYCSNDVKRLLTHLECNKYLQMSSASVYENLREDTPEEDFVPEKYSLKWMERDVNDYAEGKRQAECACFQNYAIPQAITVRFPVVMGRNDYTGRLRFYIEHVLNEKPMKIDDLDSKISFIEENEAGRFLTYLAEISNDIKGPINGCSDKSVQISKILHFIEDKTGKKAIISETGDEAPYNGYSDYSTLSTQKAKKIGFEFRDCNDWLYDLLTFELQKNKMFSE